MGSSSSAHVTVLRTHQDLCSPAVSADVPQLRATFVERRMGRLVFQQYKARAHVRLDRFFMSLCFFFFVHILLKNVLLLNLNLWCLNTKPSEVNKKAFNIHLWSTPAYPGACTWHSYSPTFNGNALSWRCMSSKEELPRRYTVSYHVFIWKYSNIYS